MILSCKVLKFMQLLKFKKVYEQQNLVCWWGDKVTQPWHSPKQLQNVTNFWRNHDLGSRNPGSQQGSLPRASLHSCLVNLWRLQSATQYFRRPRTQNMLMSHSFIVLILFPPILIAFQRFEKSSKLSQSQTHLQQWSVFKNNEFFTLSIVSPLQFFRTMGDSKSIFS